MRLGQTSAIHFVSNILASATSFVAIIYFARVVGADILGQYYLVVALLAWLKIAGQLGVGTAVIKRLSESHEQAQYIAAGGILIATLFVAMAAGLFVFRNAVDQYIGAAVTQYILLLLFSTLFYSFFTSILQGRHLVHVAGMLVPLRIATRSLLQIGAVFAGLGLAGMLVGYAAGWFVVALVALAVTVPAVARPRKRHFVRLIEYAKYSWLGSVQSQTFNWIDVVVLGFFVPSGLIGIYSVAWSVAIFLLQFSHSISDTIFPEISQLTAEGKQEQISGLVNDASGYTGVILIPGFVGGALLAEPILRIYGDEFVEGAVVLIVLIAAVLVYSYQKPFLMTLNAIDRPDLAFRVNGLFVVSNVLLNVALVYLYGWIGAAVATGVSAAIGLLSAYLFLSNLLEFSIPYREIARQWIAAVVMGVVVYGGQWAEETYHILNHNFATVLLLVCLGAGIYFGTYFVISDAFQTTVKNNLPFDILSHPDR
jgi:O-antigen/teichoic acid export membrane protein